MRQLQSRLFYGSFFLYYALTHSLNPFSLSFSKTKELSPLLFPMPPCPITPKSWEDTLAAFFAGLAFVGGGKYVLPVCHFAKGCLFERIEAGMVFDEMAPHVAVT